MYNLPTPESQIFSAVTKIVSAHSLKNKTKGTQSKTNIRGIIENYTYENFECLIKFLLTIRILVSKNKLNKIGIHWQFQVSIYNEK